MGPPHEGFRPLTTSGWPPPRTWAQVSPQLRLAVDAPSAELQEEPWDLLESLELEGGQIRLDQSGASLLVDRVAEELHLSCTIRFEVWSEVVHDGLNHGILEGQRGRTSPCSAQSIVVSSPILRCRTLSSVNLHRPSESFSTVRENITIWGTASRPGKSPDCNIPDLVRQITHLS